MLRRQRHRGRPLPSTGQTDAFKTFYFPLTTYYPPKKRLISCSIRYLYMYLSVLNMWDLFPWDFYILLCQIVLKMPIFAGSAFIKVSI